MEQEKISVSLSTGGLKQSRSARTSLALAFKHARCYQALLHDQKEDEPGRCRMKVQLNVAWRDSNCLDVRSSPTPPHVTTTTAILSMSRIFSKWIAEELWRTHTRPPMNVQYLIFFFSLLLFFFFWQPFPCLGLGFSVETLWKWGGERRNHTASSRTESQWIHVEYHRRGWWNKVPNRGRRNIRNVDEMNPRVTENHGMKLLNATSKTALWAA